MCIGNDFCFWIMQPVIISTAKCRCMINQRKKPSKLVWTQAWRRLNKKGKDEGGARKRTRRAARAPRAIVGISIEEIKRKRMTAKRTAKPRKK